MRLNLEKCIFGVEGGKFLGFILIAREALRPTPRMSNHHKHEKSENSVRSPMANGEIDLFVKVPSQVGREVEAHHEIGKEI